jgi:hypothetical protein
MRDGSGSTIGELIGGGGTIRLFARGNAYDPFVL